MTKSITIDIEDQDYAFLCDLAGENLTAIPEFTARLVQNELAAWKDDILQAEELQQKMIVINADAQRLLDDMTKRLNEALSKLTEEVSS
jgi:hypothetical protein